MKGLVVAGEASGDIYGAALSSRLLERIESLELCGMGGSRMLESGVPLLYHSDRVSVVGVFEVAAKIQSLRQAYRVLRGWILRERPDFCVLIDFPDFNFHLARLLKKQRIRTFYFISPQIWAWRKSRIHFLKQHIDLMLCILPFEEPFYRSAGVPVSYVGHPLVEIVRKEVSSQPSFSRSEKLLIGIMPGSREVEVQRHLPILARTIETIRSRLQIEPILICAPSMKFGSSVVPIGIRAITEHRYSAMKACDFLIVASGTSTLEAAILGVPFFIVYRVGGLSWQLGKLLVRIPYYGLVNWIAQKKVVPEYIQQKMDPDLLAADVVEFLLDSRRSIQMKKQLQEIVEKLGPPGSIDRAVDAILEVL